MGMQSRWIRPACSGSMAITMGNGGMNDEESLTLLGVVCSDPGYFINSKVGDTGQHQPHECRDYLPDCCYFSWTSATAPTT